MSSLEDSKLIFQQLAQADDAAPGGGVRTIIENHDAWTHNASILSQLSIALRTHLTYASRPAPISQRIARQQRRLQSLVTTLPTRLPAAG